MSNKMTDNEMRIKIAEACGWSSIRERDYYASPTDPSDIHQYWEGGNPDGDQQEIPDYLGSLDCMHEAEMTLSGAEAIQFWLNLGTVVGKPTKEPGKTYLEISEVDKVRATARQRAETFLRVIEGRAR